jgi:hypothetical protein
MIDHDVDPFERSHRTRYHDDMIFEATQNASDLKKGVKGKVSIDYWRKFSSNRKFLESKSAKYLAHEQQKERDRASIKKLEKKTKIKNKKQPTQDVRQAPGRRSYSFAAPPRTCAKFDSHIIGPINPVTTLYKDTADGSPDKDSEEMPVTSRGASRFTAPVVFCHGDIGSGTTGGKMGLAPARPAPTSSTTQTANVPSSRELDGGDRVLPGGAFGIANRFPPPPEPQGELHADCVIYFVRRVSQLSR